MKNKNIVGLSQIIKVLFIIWFPALLINKVVSANVLYTTGFVGPIRELSGNVVSVSGTFLYLALFFWCVLNYQEIKGYILKHFQPFIERWRVNREANRLKVEQDLKREVTAKEWFGYACLFLVGMLLTDTFFYDSFTSLFKGDTQSQGMPKRALFAVMLIVFHKYRSIVLVMFFVSVCVYGVLWILEMSKNRKSTVKPE